jgi:hypothetical protein
MDAQLIIDFFTMDEYEAPRPSIWEVLEGNTELTIFFIVVVLLVEIGKYTMGVKIFGKKKAAKTLIPVYGLMTLFRAIDINPWLAITSYIPLVGVVTFLFFSFEIPKAFGEKAPFQIFATFCPFFAFIILGLGQKYEFQYKKGKNGAFANEFRMVAPGDLSSDASTPADAMKAASFSYAAAAAAEQTRMVQEERARLIAEAQKEIDEDNKKAAADKEAMKKAEEISGEFFGSDEKDDGPDTASLGIEFRVVNGRFKSVPDNPTEVK